MLTKKHYTAIAAVFAEQYERKADPKRRQMTVILAHALADVFEKDNPRFDRQRFIDACYGSIR